MGILSDIIKEDSFLFSDDVDESEFNNHHVIPLGVKKEIDRKNIETRNRRSKNKNRYFINELDCLLSKIDLDFTKRVLKRLHDNYNQIFGGDYLPTEVLGKLHFEILSDNYKICDKNNCSENAKEKKKITRFFYYVSMFKGICYTKSQIEQIDIELNEKCIIPVKLLKLFEINKEDIELYLKKNFLYPNYSQFYLLWDLLSKNGHVKGHKANNYHIKYIKSRI